MARKRVGIVLFEDIEVLDFCGPFEVFSATRLNEERRREEPSPFEVLLVAECPGPVITTGGMTVLPHYLFENCPRLDVVVAPGGWGTRRQLKNPVMLGWLRDRAAEAETVTAVCTGSMLLGFAGLLEDRKSTRLNSSHDQISYAVFCLKKKKKKVAAGRPSTWYIT